MSSGESAEKETEMIFEAQELASSEEPPIDEWSSLDLSMAKENRKLLLYEQGSYHPGSGEICAKYLTMSDSSMFRHVYYNYPAVLDPGIKKALLSPEQPVIYSDDGQELYLAICREMGLAPVKKFSRGLLEKEIDLRYYCVNPRGVRPMSIALSYNKVVKVLNLTGSFLSDDACYHLGEMLMVNSTLEELNLHGCRIRHSGVLRLLNGLTVNRYLKVLNLNKNELGDDGAESLGKSIFLGLDVQKIYLSYNSIGGRGASAIAEAFETHKKLVVLDLSWNNLIAPGQTYRLLAALSESKFLQEIDLSWNALAGPRIGTAISFLMKVPNLKYLNISNNRLEGEAITNLAGNLGKAKKLVTLDLSFNPMTPADALFLLNKVKSKAVRVQRVILENVLVSAEFLAVLDSFKKMKSKVNVQVIYGGVSTRFVGVGSDPRELVLNRADFLAKRKKNPVDIALVVLQLVKNKVHVMTEKDFGEMIHNSGMPLDDGLIGEIVNVFAVPRAAKVKIIDLQRLADYVKRKWPDRKLPPTPPPEPELEVVVGPDPELPASKGKGKGKK